MSFVVEGITHCRKCGRPLENNEFCLCNECDDENKKIEKMQDVLSNEEIATRLVEAWLSSDVESIDDVLYAYDAALEHLNKVY